MCTAPSPRKQTPLPGKTGWASSGLGLRTLFTQSTSSHSGGREFLRVIGAPVPAQVEFKYEACGVVITWQQECETPASPLRLLHLYPLAAPECAAKGTGDRCACKESERCLSPSHRSLFFFFFFPGSSTPACTRKTPTNRGSASTRTA